MSEQQDYAPGDVSNGHVLTADRQWVPIGSPSPEAPKKKHTFRNVGLGAVALFTVFGIGLAASGDDEPKGEAGVMTKGEAAAKEAQANDDASPTPEPNYGLAEEDSAVYEPTTRALMKSDLVIKVRETSKQCFGSAGCNVEYKVKPLFTGSTPALDGDYDVTFAVSGDESGPITETFTVYADGTYEVPYENSASTRSSGTVLTAKITHVEKTS